MIMATEPLWDGLHRPPPNLTSARTLSRPSPPPHTRLPVSLTALNFLLSVRFRSPAVPPPYHLKCVSPASLATLPSLA